VPKIRVLVVDDAVVFRRMLTNELSADPDIEVVATAVNGRAALEKLVQSPADLVVLDVEMPEMDGLATLAAIRKTHPRLPVIMFSALTERGAAATIDALAAGANDYFAKPSAANLDQSLAVIRDQLTPKIKALAGTSSHQTAPVSTDKIARSSTDSPATKRRGPIQLVVIGASTGGPNALTTVFEGLPGDLQVPILLVQHMPPMFTRFLAERLTSRSAVPVAEAEHGTVLEAGRAWIAPGDYHLTLTGSGNRRQLALNQDPPEHSCRPSVDVLFRSASRVCGTNTLAVVLTGMGRDGLSGCELIREAGGLIVAQDEPTSVVWGMPGHVVRAGLADCVLPIDSIADEIVARVRKQREPSR
jgi:two-component system chemotaxis response regulator CheB